MNYGMVSSGCKMSCGSTPQNLMTFKNKSFIIFVKHTFYVKTFFENHD